MQDVASRFSLISMVRSIVAGTWGKLPSYEHSFCEGLEREFGEFHTMPHALRIPPSALTRDLNVGTASAGGYLAPLLNRDDLYLPALQPTSVCLQLGAQIVPAGAGQIAIPRGASGVTTTMLSTETSTATETNVTFGQVGGSPKILSAFVEVSRQLLLQSNADAILRTELTRAAGAKLDAMILQGSGNSGEPTGIVNTASIGAFTGASLNQAACRNAQADVLAANANVGGRFGYATTPAVAEILSTRQRFTGSDRALWEGSLADGVLEGERAMCTANCPSATAVYADWSTVYVPEWAGGLGIQVDPFTKFTQGIVGVRLLLAFDVLVTRAAAISVATSVS